jgi:hypothetical protein
LDLPVPVKDAKDKYLAAVREVIDDFFADPDNEHAKEIIDRVQGRRLGLHRASVMAEARKHVLDSVRRM